MDTAMIDKITDSEWEIMRIVWTKRETTSSEIIEILDHKTEWKPSTVKTLLARLVEKGMLQTSKVGNKYIYTPLVEENISIKQAAEHLLTKVCNKKTGNLIELIMEERTLSFDDIDKLEALLEEKRKTAVESVSCNCVPGQCNCDS
ncbi:transcriptional repressor CopY [Listeria floridensis FSL S10-1187]|uniref:Transcriptional repressor CopY n=1 Tax=Listeria floridensis FSL S10-1187 TaxID=1265817 RepID=A0ABP3AWT3_9LIST|nr:CopY/TcrY family copper transport repressor [Listeria floridensis]EUJ30551.1 transcriptional repressor CopY [Listeria floridensis FSL S10-1187]